MTPVTEYSHTQAIRIKFCGDGSKVLHVHARRADATVPIIVVPRVGVHDQLSSGKSVNSHVNDPRGRYYGSGSAEINGTWRDSSHHGHPACCDREGKHDVCDWIDHHAPNDQAHTLSVSVRKDCRVINRSA